MESKNSVTLQTCEDNSILIETVKNIVNENTRTELKSEAGLIAVSDVLIVNQNATDARNPNEESTTQTEEKLSLSSLCRVCAGGSDHLIPIFEGEGLQHELCSKIHKYLPIRVCESDTLPLQLCYHCAATLLAWHELLEGCLTAEKNLLEMQESFQEKQGPEALEPSTQDTESLHQQQENLKDEASEEAAANDSERSKNLSDGVARILKVKNEKTNGEEIEYVQCVRCDTIFVSMQYFINHMNVEHDARMYYCQYCKLVYGRQKEFENHMIAHHDDGKVLDNVAEGETLKRAKGRSANKEDLLKEAAPIVKTEPLAYFTCHLCEKNFVTKLDLKQHIKRHTDRSSAKDLDETELVNKARQVIDNRVSYKCNTCKKVLVTRRGFLRHIRVHFDTRPCVCDVCGKSYRIEQDLARHIRDVHEGLKKYACDICGRAFANKGAKDDHRRIHTGERPYACDHCPKMFRTLNSIYIHNRVHTDYKPHKCSYCEKYFRSRQRRNHHETTHTRIKTFACEICGKTFSIKGEVVRHRATHNEEKPFDCKCGMKFRQKRYLRSHIKQRHKEASSLLLEELSGNNN